MRTVTEEPVGSVLYGLVRAIFIGLVALVLVLTLVGIIVALPLRVLTYLAWAVGAAIAFLAVGDRLVGREGGWTRPLLVGAAINGGLTVTGLGGILTFGIGAAGFGAVVREYLE